MYTTTKKTSTGENRILEMPWGAVMEGVHHERNQKKK